MLINGGGADAAHILKLAAYDPFNACLAAQFTAIQQQQQRKWQFFDAGAAYG
jgi:hypothetical protein